MLPKTGVDSSFLHSYLKLAAWVVPLAAVLGWGYYRLLAKTSRPAGDDARPSVVRRRAGVAWLLLVAAGLGYFAGAAYYLAHRKQVFAFFLKSREQTTLYEDHYRAVRPEDVTFDTPPPTVGVT
jgi:purine-cytosine permease-like protein